jgi:hypothetical protein
MFRNTLAALAAVVLVGASLMPDDAFVGAVAAATGVEAIAEAPPMSGAGRFMAAVTALPVGDTELRDAATDTVQHPAAR